MSDLVAQYDGAVPELDEETLVSALRNQDDIPILMDVVVEQVHVGVSQETHFSQSFEKVDEHEEVEVGNAEASSFSQALISKAIAEVLEKRLPELVAEVMQTLNLGESSNKKD
jgi:hypothetical protein